jgi:hypothetical protein
MREASSRYTHEPLHTFNNNPPSPLKIVRFSNEMRDISVARIEGEGLRLVVYPVLYWWTWWCMYGGACSCRKIEAPVWAAKFDILMYMDYIQDVGHKSVIP